MQESHRPKNAELPTQPRKNNTSAEPNLQSNFRNNKNRDETKIESFSIRLDNKKEEKKEIPVAQET